MKKILTLALLLVTLAGNATETLTLEKCLQLAKEHNRTLQSAALDIQMAGLQKEEARMKYYPEISANVMAFYSFDKMIKGTLPAELAAFDALAGLAGTKFGELNRGYSLGVTAVEPIYTGGRITNGNKLAQINEDIQYLQKSLKEKDVVQKVTENFWKIAIIKYNLKTISAAEKQIAAVKTDVENYVKAGVTNQNDLLKVLMREQELKSNRLKLENAEHVLLLLLAQQIGLANTTIDIDLGDDTPVNPYEFYVLAKDATGSREELKMINKGMTAQELQIEMEKGKNLPTVAVGLMGMNSGFGGIDATLKKNMKTNITNALVFGTVSIPISSWFTSKSTIKREQVKLEQMKNQYLDAEEQLRVDIESSWSGVIEAYKQIDIAQATVTQAAENLRMSTDQFEAGTETLVNLLDAETLNRQALDQLSSAKATYQIRLAEYMRKTR